MGTQRYVDEMVVACERGQVGGRRQLEVFVPSGTREIHLRVGDLKEIDNGTTCMELTAKSARILLEGLERAMVYLDYPFEERSRAE